jgi:hypothetical protein
MTRFVQSHPVLMLLTAPILGLLFVMFLPLLGFLTVIHMLLNPVFGQLARVVRPSWQPFFAYLHRGRPGVSVQTDDPWMTKTTQKLPK